MVRISDTVSIAFRQLVEGGKPPVVMQVVPALESGGVEQGVIDINAAIVKAGGKSIVVAAFGKRVHEITRAGGTFVQLPVKSKNPLTMLLNVWRLRRVIRKYNVDVVHACSRAPAWSARRAVKGTKAHFITSCHAAHTVGNIFKRFYNSSIASGERVIAVSHFLADYLEQNYGTDPEKIRVIHRGITLAKYHPNAVTPERLIKVAQSWRVPDGASVIMLPGRVTRKKGHQFLIDALYSLRMPDVFCVFLGSSLGNEAYRAELEKYISEKGLEGSVRIVPACDDMPAAYMLATVTVAPTLEPEGFGRIAIEAQAMGRPVIVTDHGGVRETVLRDETGWMVPAGDVSALASAVREALSLDNKERALLATRGMAHVAENFTNDKMCSKTLDVYAEVINGGKAVKAAKPAKRKKAA